MAIDFTIPTRHPKHNVSQVGAYTWLAGWKDERMDGWINGWMDGWVSEEWVEQEKKKKTKKMAKEKVKKSNDSIVVAQHGIEIAVCALIDLIRSGFGHRVPTTDGKRSQS